MHRKEQGFSHVLLFLLFIVIVGAIGFTGWYVASKNHLIGEPNTASAVISYIKQDLGSKFTVDTAKVDVSEPGHIRFLVPDRADTGSGPLYQAAGYDFSNTPQTGHDSSLIVQYYATASDNQADPNAQSIADFLKAKLTSYGLKSQPAPAGEIDETMIGNSNASASDIVDYVNRFAVCEIGQNGNDHTITLDCADLSAYAPAAAMLKPFADAYYAAKPYRKGQASFTDLTVRNSKTSGYQIGNVAVDNSVAFFYAKGGSWQFIYSAQSVLTCEQFETQYPAAVPAYRGESCFSSLNGTNSTIR